MGQRTIRRKLEEKHSQCEVDQTIFNNSTRTVIGKLDVNFNLDNPVQKTKSLKHLVHESTIIHNLVINLTSRIFGTGEVYRHFNLYLIFGANVINKNVENIFVRLCNSETQSLENERKLMFEFLNYLYFNEVKKVYFNNFYKFFVSPGNSKFASLLTIDDNFENVEDYLNLILFNNYAEFKANNRNFKECINFIEKIIPRTEKNISLPLIKLSREIISTKTEINPFKNEILSEFTNGEKENFNSLPNTNIVEFFKYLGRQFDFINLEFKVSGFYESQLEICNSIETLVGFLIEHLKTFKHCICSFWIEELKIGDFSENMQILNCFKKLIKKYLLSDLTFTLHTYREVESDPQQLSNIYDYCFFNKILMEKTITVLCLLKSQKMKKIFYKKPILKNILDNLFDFNDLFRLKRIDFSTKEVINRKVVPIPLADSNLTFLIK